MKLPAFLLSLALFFAGVGSSSALVLLSVDFNDGDSGLTQDGFEVFDASDADNQFRVYGDYTVTLPGTLVDSRDRGAFSAGDGSYTYHDLTRDLVTQITRVNSATPLETAPSAAALTIGGLEANMEYNIRIWAVDRGYNNGVVQGFWDMNTSGGPTLFDSVINQTGSAPPADNDAFSAFGTVWTDSNGVLSIGYSTTGSNSGVLNGFQLSAIPEPGTGILLLAGLAAFSLVRRRIRTA